MSSAHHHPCLQLADCATTTIGHSLRCSHQLECVSFLHFVIFLFFSPSLLLSLMDFFRCCYWPPSTTHRVVHCHHWHVHKFHIGGKRLNASRTKKKKMSKQISTFSIFLIRSAVGGASSLSLSCSRRHPGRT